MEKELNCKFIRINPNKENFDIFVEISKIQNHIKKSIKELRKETVTDDISKLLKLKFKENNDIKTNCLKRFVKSILPNL